MSAEQIIVERTYPVPSEKVWQAITEHDKLKEWFFKLPDFRAEPGFEFVIADNNGRDKHLCRITEVVPGKKLVFSFSNISAPGMSDVTYELFDEGENTRLKLTHTGLETFPLDQPGYMKKNYEEGWTYLFGTALKNYFEQNNS